MTTKVSKVTICIFLKQPQTKVLGMSLCTSLGTRLDPNSAARDHFIYDLLTLSDLLCAAPPALLKGMGRKLLFRAHALKSSCVSFVYVVTSFPLPISIPDVGIALWESSRSAWLLRVHGRTCSSGNRNSWRRNVNSSLSTWIAVSTECYRLIASLQPTCHGKWWMILIFLIVLHVYISRMHYVAHNVTRTCPRGRHLWLSIRMVWYWDSVITRATFGVNPRSAWYHVLQSDVIIDCCLSTFEIQRVIARALHLLSCSTEPKQS